MKLVYNGLEQYNGVSVPTRWWHNLSDGGYRVSYHGLVAAKGHLDFYNHVRIRFSSVSALRRFKLKHPDIIRELELMDEEYHYALSTGYRHVSG